MAAVEYSSVMSASLLAALALVIAPLLFVMIYKSERKQAKFAHHYGCAQNDLASIEFDKAMPEHNFKLVCGSGELTCDYPIADELFGLSVGNALRIQRTVEMKVLEPETKDKALLDIPCDRNKDLEEEDVDTDDSDNPPKHVDRSNYIPKWREIKEENFHLAGKNKLRFGSRVTYATEANLGQHVLN